MVPRWDASQVRLPYGTCGEQRIKTTEKHEFTGKPAQLLFSNDVVEIQEGIAYQNASHVSLPCVEKIEVFLAESQSDKFSAT